MCIGARRICRSLILVRITKSGEHGLHRKCQMLTLIERQPRTAPLSWNKVIRLSRQARALMATWRSRARQRQALARLDERLLADIGLTREAQMVECSKLFW
jgi:uncharacterized protein YjiS (DUF1127 family)